MRPGDAQTHNGTGFLLLVVFHYKMIFNNKVSLSSIDVLLIFPCICYSPDEEVKRDVNFWMIAAIILNFLLSELQSLYASSIRKSVVIHFLILLSGVCTFRSQVQRQVS